MTPEPDEQLEQKIADINALYRQAPELAKHGGRTVSTDELTGAQALERKHPGLPLAPGKVERREFEYIRHGTQSLIVNFDVATVRVDPPWASKARLVFWRQWQRRRPFSAIRRIASSSITRRSTPPG